MSVEVFYRDPRISRDVHGPFSVERLRDLVREGRLRPTDQVSVDGRAWLAAVDFEPPLFIGGTNVDLVGQPAWKRSAASFGRLVRTWALAAWAYVKRVANFYWSHRTEMRQLATEYLPFLKEHGGRQELRVSAADRNDHVFLDDDGRWQASLPDCCVVCGQAADCDWNSEQRSVPDLTWPLLCPVFGLLLGTVGWIFLWSSEGRWLILIGVLSGFVVGYTARGETVVAIRFRRCREHLNRTRYPALRTFGKMLIIGVGDRKVWRRFYYGDRDLETPAVVPPDYLAAIQSQQSSEQGEPKPSYPTIPLAGDEEAGTHPL